MNAVLSDSVMAEVQDSQICGLVEEPWMDNLYLVVRQMQLLKE